MWFRGDAAVPPKSVAASHVENGAVNGDAASSSSSAEANFRSMSGGRRGKSKRNASAPCAKSLRKRRGTRAAGFTDVVV